MKKCKISWNKELCVGKTDAVTTYCCSATPCYYVVFDDGYGHYYPVHNVVFVD